MAAGVIFRVADDLDPPSVFVNCVALRNRVSCIVGSLGLNLGANFPDNRAHIELGKNYDCVDWLKCSHNFRALLLGNDRAPFTFQRTHGLIGVDGDHEFTAQGLGRNQVTNVSDMEEIECAIREYDALSGAAPLLDLTPQFLAAEDFVVFVQCAL